MRLGLKKSKIFFLFYNAKDPKQYQGKGPNPIQKTFNIRGDPK